MSSAGPEPEQVPIRDLVRILDVLKPFPAGRLEPGDPLRPREEPFDVAVVHDADAAGRAGLFEAPTGFVEIRDAGLSRHSQRSESGRMAPPWMPLWAPSP